MSGTDKTLCLIDARATRAKARVDAQAARNKAFAKANVSGSSLMEEDDGAAGVGG